MSKEGTLSPSQPAMSFEDPAWTAAVEWLLRVRASPEDLQLADELRRWLDADERHARAYRKAQRVWRVAGDVPPIHVPAPEPAMVQKAAASKPRPSRVRQAVLALAACFAVAMVAPDIWQRVRADYSTATGQIQSVTLADGSVADLSAASRVAVRYTPERREVELLAGAAYFDVKRDTERPFVVRSGPFAVTVKGTAFEVSQTRNGVSVSVERGTVWVSGPGTSPVTLQPGMRSRIVQNGEQAELSNVAPSSIASWRGGRLMVNDVPLADVIDEMRRYVPGIVLVTASSIENRRVTGIFDMRDPRGALESLLAPFDGSIRTMMPYVIVVDAP